LQFLAACLLQIKNAVESPVVVGSKEPPPPVGENFHRIQAAAADGSNTHQQAIALTALGFAERNELMPLILQGAQLSDPFLVDHAVLGLAILKAPDTPPGVLASIVWRADHPEDGRAQAAWALYRIQEVTENQEPIIAIWKQFLTDGRSKLPAGALVCAVRGLGLTRDKQYADLVAPYLTHPVARLRMAAAIAIARMNAQQYAVKLIDLLGPPWPMTPRRASISPPCRQGATRSTRSGCSLWTTDSTRWRRSGSHR
jgi:hypothetical protein